jgi:hypothetical protein
VGDREGKTKVHGNRKATESDAPGMWSMDLLMDHGSWTVDRRSETSYLTHLRMDLSVDLAQKCDGNFSGPQDGPWTSA